MSEEPRRAKLKVEIRLREQADGKVATSIMITGRRPVVLEMAALEAFAFVRDYMTGLLAGIDAEKTLEVGRIVLPEQGGGR